MLKLKNKFITANCLLLIMGAVFFVGVNIVGAQETDIGLNYAANLGLEDGGGKDIRVFLAEIVRYFITFLGIIAVAMVMYSGFLWMTSAGDPEKVNRAKQALVNSVIGLIIIISAFAIVTFIINFMAGGGGGGTAKKKPLDYGYGLGAYGNCAIASTYPEPFQKDVPRNTVIIVTFIEEVEITSMQGTGNNIDTEVVRIYKKNDENNPVSASISSTADKRTFIFQPTEYLGSPSENTEYYVYLSNDILKPDGKGVFENCLEKFALWSFEVSTKVDLTPPQVKAGGIFPAPDNNQDSVAIVSAAQASGEIAVLGAPEQRKLANFNIDSGSKPASLDNINEYSEIEGILTLAVSDDGETVRLTNDSTNTGLGTAAINGQQVVFPSLFTLILTEGGFAAGDFWTISATAYTAGDTLTVGAYTYYFGAGGITVDTNLAVNIRSKLDNHPDVIPSISGSIITITARDAGAAGNSIVLSASNSTAIGITPMSGGQAAGETTVASGRTDRPRNSVIQINFNEAINPIGITGIASGISDNIRVENISDNNNILNGKFILSNQYKTLEFISDELCGKNGCGESIYCLPANSNLRVVIKAASLYECSGNPDCAARAPYVYCSGTCKNGDDKNYPLANFNLTGVADMAFNSMDGDRDTFAEGPEAQSYTPAYNENEIIGLCASGANQGRVCTDENKAAVCGEGILCENPKTVSALQADTGDDYSWSFFISNSIKIQAPVIDTISPDHKTTNASLSESIKFQFKELMMSSSLGTGQVKVFDGEKTIVHKKVNLRSLNNRAVGYWTAVENVDEPVDGEPDWTRAQILHPQFPQYVSYRAQVGSGVKDIYQNCFKPSEGPLCENETSDASPSCCPVIGGTEINAVGAEGLDKNGNCK